MAGLQGRLSTSIPLGCWILACLIIIASATASSAHAEEPAWTLGAHFGGDVVDNMDENASIASIYGRRQLATPEWLANWTPRGTSAHLDATATYLEIDDDGGAHLAVGPVLAWRAPEGPWRVTGGVQPTLISDHDPSTRELGGPLQFTLHLEAGIALNDRATIGLQWRHTSNADLYDDNDGINVQLLSVDWRF
jgi:hypothetical protein